MSFAKLNPEYIIKRTRQYDPEPQNRQRHRGVCYFMSFCVWCAHSYKL